MATEYTDFLFRVLRGICALKVFYHPSPSMFNTFAKNAHRSAVSWMINEH
jgi:hypothetical protein